VQNPVLLAEVLSKSTLRYDLGEKFDLFRRLPTLMDFIAVRKDERRVLHGHRTDVGRWLLTEVEGDGAVELPGFGATLSLAEIYEKVALLPEEG
jgi:Uma2 family endonuclease